MTQAERAATIDRGRADLSVALGMRAVLDWRAPAPCCTDRSLAARSGPV